MFLNVTAFEAPVCLSLKGSISAAFNDCFSIPTRSGSDFTQSTDNLLFRCRTRGQHSANRPEYQGERHPCKERCRADMKLESNLAKRSEVPYPGRNPVER